MWDLAFFRGDILDLRRKKGWEAGISVASGSGILCFYRAAMRDWQGKQSGIRESCFSTLKSFNYQLLLSDFTFSCDS